MKKTTLRFICLLVTVALLFCACTSADDSGATAEPTQPSTTTPTQAPTVAPTTAPTAAPTVAPTAAPTVAPTVAPTEPPAAEFTEYLVQTRQVTPFEDRFKEDFSFHSPTTWLIPEGDHYIAYRAIFPNNRFAIEKLGTDTTFTKTPVKDVVGYALVTADGQFATFGSKTDFKKVNIATGEHTILLTMPQDLLHWNAQACGPDTVCIVTLTGTDREFHAFYLDVHTGATRTIYRYHVPETYLDTFYVFFPDSALDTVSWSMVNPDFYAAMQEELKDPNSPCKTHYAHQNTDYSSFWENQEHVFTSYMFCENVQHHVNIPFWSMMSCSLGADAPTETLGIIDKCWFGSGYAHDHFDYENTYEEKPQIINAAPTPLYAVASLTQQQIDDILAEGYGSTTGVAFLSNEYGSRQLYLALDGVTRRLTDSPVVEFVNSKYFVYCVTAEGSVLQLSHDGKICNTMYTGTAPDSLSYEKGELYFRDGDYVLQINIISGCSRILLKSGGLLDVKAWGPGNVFIEIVHGLYDQQYIFTPETGELKPVSIL